MELLIVNTALLLYISFSLYQIIKYRNSIVNTAFHHFLSHLFIMIFFIISINLFHYKGFVSPVVFAVLYTIQHLVKENLRLIKTGKWTDSVRENEL